MKSTKINLTNKLKSENLIKIDPKLKKKELIDLNNVIDQYKEEKKECDYKNFNFGGDKIVVNQEQYGIITADLNINMRIIACAGSGKTTTIVCRIKYLIDNGIDPERIMLTTFNVDAAQNMRNKLIKLFGFMPNIKIGTIDSIACGFYHKYFKKDYHIDVSEYATELLNFLETGAGSIITNIYQYIFFDEFQDASKTQFNILKHFYKHGANITIIGDDAQNIYQFRGSDVDFILNIEKYIDNMITYKLIHNYRSTPEIIKFANDSISKNIDQLKKDMLPTNPSIGLKPIIKHYKNINQHNNDIINQIKYYISQGIQLHEIAIISRNTYPLKSIEESIEQHNINSSPYLNYVALISDDRTDVAPKIKDHHIILTTIHKSKGLEWKVVFLIKCEDKTFPSDTDKLLIEEERRLFYVAVTRARHHLLITFCDTFTSTSQITRFVSEIDPQYYDAPNIVINNQYEQHSYSKNENNVTKIIRYINENDIKEMRETKLIPNFKLDTLKIHDSCMYNQTINDYYLHADYGEFIDRYICRQICVNNKLSINDRYAEIVILACTLDSDQYNIYGKYINHFIKNGKYITKDTPISQVISILNREMRVEIDKNDHPFINIVVTKLLQYTGKLTISEIFVVNNSKKFAVFRDELKTSYDRYKNISIHNKKIMRDIYHVSLCSNIYDSRTRLIYKDVFADFTQMNIFTNIDQFINITNNTEISCKKVITDPNRDIVGEYDMITDDMLIDFKCSQSSGCKLSWILQLLTYLSILHSINKDLRINRLGIYNPLSGELISFDVQGWDKFDEYLDFLERIKREQSNRTLKSPEVNNNPAIHVMPCKNDKKIIDNKDNIMNQHAEYIVLDTETTGLPDMIGFGNYYHFSKNDKYDKSRIVQISWNHYNYKHELLDSYDFIIKPSGFDINNSSFHGITNEIANKNGVNIQDALKILQLDIENISIICGHNISFDINIILNECYRLNMNALINMIQSKKQHCTMCSSIGLKINNSFKVVSLKNLYIYLFNKEPNKLHNSKYDIQYTHEIYLELIKKNIIKK